MLSRKRDFYFVAGLNRDHSTSIKHLKDIKQFLISFCAFRFTHLRFRKDISELVCTSKLSVNLFMQITSKEERGNNMPLWVNDRAPLFYDGKLCTEQTWEEEWNIKWLDQTLIKTDLRRDLKKNKK